MILDLKKLNMNYTPMTRREVLAAYAEGLITNWERRYLLRIARRAWLRDHADFPIAFFACLCGLSFCAAMAFDAFAMKSATIFSLGLGAFSMVMALVVLLINEIFND